MAVFNVRLKKKYHNRGLKASRTVYGILPIEAETSADATLKVDEMMRYAQSPSSHVLTTLQTNDPRIIWDVEAGFNSEGYWDYVDFSFEMPDVRPRRAKV